MFRRYPSNNSSTVRRKSPREQPRGQKIKRVNSINPVVLNNILLLSPTTEAAVYILQISSFGHQNFPKGTIHPSLLSYQRGRHRGASKPARTCWAQLHLKVLVFAAASSDYT